MADARPRDADTTRLDREGYQRLRAATRTHRERVVVRLAGEAGLRPGEMVAVRPGEVTARLVDGTVHRFLHVRADDREAYVPSEVARALERYARSNGIADEEPLFEVSPRRLQMLVSEVADRAATSSGRPSLADVSTADLRAYHARSLLERGVDPRVVRAVGGWARLESLPTDPEPAPERVAAAFERAEAGTRGDDGRFRAALDRVAVPAVLLDADAAVTYANRRFAARFDDLDPVGRPLRDLLALRDDRDYGAMWEAVTGGETWVGPANLPDGDGDARLRLVPLRASGPDRYLASISPPDGDSAAVDRSFERLDAVREAVDPVAAVLADASTREGILEGVCEALTDAPAYEFAWVTDAPPNGDSVTAWAGNGDGSDGTAAGGPGDGNGIEALPRPEDEEPALARHAARDGAVHAAVLGDEEPWSLAAVPVAHGETVYGSLVVADRRSESPGDDERLVLETLGDNVGHALAAVEWKRLLLADTVLELEFASEDDASPLVAASGALDCTLRVDGLVPLAGDAMLAYVMVSGVPPDRALEHTGDRVENSRLIADYSDESLLEVTLGPESLLATFVQRGGNVRSLEAESGEARITCEFAPTTDVRRVVGAVGEASPSATFLAKREVERSARSPIEYQRALEERLTDRQRTVLQAAYHSGYFDWPRGSTAEELADSVGVSSPTLHNHLRRAERKLLAAYFEEPEND
jgi:PAS domain-containing protein/DNA-binding CsgD family transcriptional regulator